MRKIAGIVEEIGEPAEENCRRDVVCALKIKKVTPFPRGGQVFIPNRGGGLEGLERIRTSCIFTIVGFEHAGPCNCLS